jgi:hypothetical protein
MFKPWGLTRVVSIVIGDLNEDVLPIFSEKFIPKLHVIKPESVGEKGEEPSSLDYLRGHLDDEWVVRTLST